MIPNVCLVVEVNGVNRLVLGCSDSGAMLFLLIIWALRQVGCETVGHLVTNASLYLIGNGCPGIILIRRVLYCNGGEFSLILACFGQKETTIC